MHATTRTILVSSALLIFLLIVSMCLCICNYPDEALLPLEAADLKARKILYSSENASRMNSQARHKRGNDEW